ncbi:hypothetical protein [Proteiniphilum sp. X52]|nr:hypothetical protein [Proteiniphilum sp. X52]
MHEESNKPAGEAKEEYISPEIEIIEVETSQHILGGSTELPGVGDGGDAW